MKIKKTVYYAYLKDCQGNTNVTFYNDHSDNITIGGYDINGKYQQYDSYEAYYASPWAIEHGFVYHSGYSVELELDI